MSFFHAFFFFFCRWRQSCGVWWPCCPPSSLIPPFSGSSAELSELNSLPYQYFKNWKSSVKVLSWSIPTFCRKWKAGLHLSVCIGSMSGSCISKKFWIWILRAQNVTFIKKIQNSLEGSKIVFRIHNPDEKYILAAGLKAFPFPFWMHRSFFAKYLPFLRNSLNIKKISNDVRKY